jgi:N-acetylglucosamine-6-sulfatase
LDALLLVLKSCKAESCRDPWKILHERGGIRSLPEALSKDQDEYYSTLPKVKYDHCAGYYDYANEAPYFGYAVDTNTTAQQATVVNNPSKRPEREVPPQDIVDLFNLIPVPKSAGHVMVDDDFEALAKPVPDQLMKTVVDWSKYGFYSYGS